MQDIAPNCKTCAMHFVLSSSEVLLQHPFFSGTLMPLSQLQVGPIGTHLSLIQPTRGTDGRMATEAYSSTGLSILSKFCSNLNRILMSASKATLGMPTAGQMDPTTQLQGWRSVCYNYVYARQALVVWANQSIRSHGREMTEGKTSFLILHALISQAIINQNRFTFDRIHSNGGYTHFVELKAFH